MDGKKTLKSCLGRRNLFVVLVCLNMLVLTADVADAANPNLVAHWKFDEGSGGTAYDSAGDNDGMLINNPTRTTGRIGGALEFDGVDDYVIKNPFNNFPATEITAEFWMESSDTSKSGTPISYATSHSANEFLIFDYRNFQIYIRDSYITTGVSANDGSWHHITVTWRSSDGGVKLYKDGNLAYSGTLRTGYSIVDGGSLVIAQEQDRVGGGFSVGQAFLGVIDNVRIYDRALSAEEILQLYGQGLGGRAFNPWPADGAVVVDPNVVVSWTGGTYAASHDVYFGTDYSDVNDATTDSPDYMGRTDANSYWPGPLELGTSYYWRIDEVNDANSNSPWKGDVWRFKTWVEPNLVSWWRFEEGSGSTAYDSAGGNHGTLVNGPVWTSGQIGGALSFDGSNDHVSVPLLNLYSDTVTMSAWIKRDGVQAWTYTGIVICRDGHTTAGISFGKGPGGWGDINHELAYNWNDDQAAWDWHSGLIVPDNEWVFVALVVEPTKATMYLNDASATNVLGHSMEEFDGVTWIGQDAPGWDRNFKGVIDDVRIYDRALSAEEILQLYQEGLGGRAFRPKPFDGASGVDPNVVVSWTAGTYAASHDVYFGTDFNDVNDATTSSSEYKGNQEATSYWPGPLELGTSYYWRIDEVNDANTNSPWKGDVWRFKTWVEPNLVAWWRFEEGSGTTAYDSAGGNHGSLVSGPVWTTGQVGGALSFDGVNDYVEVPDSASLDITDEITLGAWVLIRDVTWEYDRIVVKTFVGDVEPWNVYGIFRDGNSRKLTFEISTTANLPNGIQSDTDVLVLNEWTHVAGTFDGSTVSLFVNGELIKSHDAPHPGYINTNNIPLSIGANNVGNREYLNGKIDEVRIYDRALSAEEIMQLYGEGLGGRAFGPEPEDGATYVVYPNMTVLSWMGGTYATSHDVYFGTNYSDVNDATTDSAEYMGNQYDNSYWPGPLELGRTYYWRIDEVNDANTNSPWKGDVWSFTTVGCITDVYWADWIEGGVIGVLLEGLVDEWLNWDGWRCYLNGEQVHMEGTEEGAFTILPNDWLEAPPTGLWIGSEPWLSTVRGTDFPCVGTLQFYVPGRGFTNIYEFNILGEGCETEAGPAQNPRPADGASTVDPNVELSWMPGPYAASHNVYFGTDFNDVNDAATSSAEYMGNQDVNSYDPCGLEPNTTYYWRIDEVDGADIWKGDVWSFTTIPFRAYNPRPSDGDSGVPVDMVLSWDAGFDALSHDVYFGKRMPLPFKGNQTKMKYDPGILPKNTTYWWRVDEVGPDGTIPGEQWSFTTGAHRLGELKIISWNIEFLGIRSPRRTQEQLDAIAERILTFDAAVLALQEIADVSVLEYIRSQMGPSWKIYHYSDNWNALLYDENKVEMLSVELLYTLDNPPYTSYPEGRPRPVTGVFRAAGTQGTELFRVISVHCSPWGSAERAAEGEWLRAKIIEWLEDPDEPNDIILLGDLNGEPPGGAPHPQLQQGGYLYLLPKENGDSWDRIDHFYVTQSALEKLQNQSTWVIRPEHYGETTRQFVATYSDHLPISIEFVCVWTTAREPAPEDGASGVSPDVVVGWTKGASADRHDIYFGTGFDDVNDATKDSPDYIGRTDANSYYPGGLDANNAYYWRIDEVNESDGNSPWKGKVWSFTTGKTVHVPTEYVTIQQAVELAWDGVSVTISEGTHYENIDFKGKNLTVRSTDPNDPNVVANTVINGSSQGSVVTFSGGEDANCVLAGFTITGGVTSGNGGGVSGNRTLAGISNCVIKNNSAYRGGGLANFNGTIDECIIIGNLATNWGGGMNACHGKITNCLIYGNSGSRGGGLSNCDGEIINCTIVSNTATEAGGGLRRCDGTIRSCIIWNNVAVHSSQIHGYPNPTYSCIQDWTGGGTGNIDADPCFAEGSWALLEGMVSYWKFNEGSGSTAYDSAGENHGTLVNGPAWTSEPIGGALIFDGVNDYIDVAHSPDFNIETGFTVELWFKAKPTQLSPDKHFAVIDKSHRSTESPPYWSGWIMQGRVDIDIGRLWFGIGNGTDFPGVSTNTSVLDDIWHHVAGVFDGTKVKLYFDGVLQGSTVFSGTPVNNTDPLNIGRWATGATRNFNGHIDEVAIYNRALSTAEIGRLYRLEFLGRRWGLIGWPDPHLLPGPGHYHLLRTSPCVDAGDPNYVAGPNETDLDGNPRIVDGDNDGNSVVDMGAYEYRPPTPAELVAELLEGVGGLELPRGIENGLEAKLEAALGALEDENENNDIAAINTLGAFINAVEAQCGKKIPEAEADALIAAAMEIIDLLSDS